MNTEGTLAYRDRHDREQRVSCSGGLNTQVDGDGAMRVYGVLNVDAPHVEALREVMSRQAEEGAPAALRYSGEVRTVDGEDTRAMTDVPLRVQSVTDDGTVRLESDRMEEA